MFLKFMEGHGNIPEIMSLNNNIVYNNWSLVFNETCLKEKIWPTFTRLNNNNNANMIKQAFILMKSLKFLIILVFKHFLSKLIIYKMHKHINSYKSNFHNS